MSLTERFERMYGHHQHSIWDDGGVAGNLAKNSKSRARRAPSNPSDEEDSKGSDVNPFHQRDLQDHCRSQKGQKIEETISC